MWLRITPGIDAHTHEYVRTGHDDSKFGFTLSLGLADEAVRRCGELAHVEVVGAHAHIGSQIFGTDPFIANAEVMVELLAHWRDELGVELSELNLGGGMGIRYTHEDHPVEVARYGEAVLDAVDRACARHGYPRPQLAVEPGRAISAPSTVTLYEVGTVKELPGLRTYVSVDGGMSDNIRPALYQAEHEVTIANRADTTDHRAYTRGRQALRVRRPRARARPAAGRSRRRRPRGGRGHRRLHRVDGVELQPAAAPRCGARRRRRGPRAHPARDLRRPRASRRPAPLTAGPPMATPPVPDTPGLRSVRASLSPATELLRGPGHVALVTPSRRDFHEGNALHVEEPVDAGDLDRWLAAFEERFGHLAGVDHRRVLWETGPGLTDAGAYAERLRAAAEARGLDLDRMTLMALGEELRPMAPFTDGVEAVRAVRDVHWAGVRALHASSTPTPATQLRAWRTAELAALADAGRGGVWLAFRFGVPVATCALFRDGAGIASLDDVITHAVHRQLGIASHLAAVACGAHRAAFPDDRILLLADHGSAAERLYARLGFAPIGTVWALSGEAQETR